MVKVGLIDYLNFLPLTMELRAQQTFPIILGTPAQLNAAMLQGALDCSLMSAAAYFDGGHRLVAPFGIYAKGKIRSVNLYIKNSLADLDGAMIGLTEQSATSISLLKVLCHHFWKVSPQFEVLKRDSMEQYEGFLLIGDEALEKEKIGGYITIDLATAWEECTDLPFVFGVLAARKEVPEASFEGICESMQRSLDSFRVNPEAVFTFAKKRSSLSEETLSNYYSLCHYHLDDKAKEGLQLFQKLRQHVLSK